MVASCSFYGSLSFEFSLKVLILSAAVIEKAEAMKMLALMLLYICVFVLIVN